VVNLLHGIFAFQAIARMVSCWPTSSTFLVCMAAFLILRSTRHNMTKYVIIIIIHIIIILILSIILYYYTIATYR